MTTKELAKQAARLLTQRNPQQAIQLLRATAADPACTDPYVHCVYANALTKTGRSSDAADHLRPLVARGGLLERDPVAHATLAIALINAYQPQEALKVVASLPLAERRGNPVLTYTEAKANFATGDSGATLNILRSIDQLDYKNAHTILYLACLDDSEQQAGIFKTVLGRDFTRLWEKSRQLQESIHVLRDEERSMFRANPVWELGAQPVNSAAVRELGFVSNRVREAARYSR